MTKSYYECHVTMEAVPDETPKPWVGAYVLSVTAEPDPVRRFATEEEAMAWVDEDRCERAWKHDPDNQFPVPDEDPTAKARAVVEGLGWKFSQIAGDIVLGDGVKMYATRHFNVKLGDAAVTAMLHDTANAIGAAGVKVVRRKVERVIYDDRSSKVRPCDGACPECHLDDLKPGGYDHQREAYARERDPVRNR